VVPTSTETAGLTESTLLLSSSVFPTTYITESLSKAQSSYLHFLFIVFIFKVQNRLFVSEFALVLVLPTIIATMALTTSIPITSSTFPPAQLTSGYYRFDRNISVNVTYHSYYGFDNFHSNHFSTNTIQLRLLIKIWCYIKLTDQVCRPFYTLRHLNYYITSRHYGFFIYQQYFYYYLKYY